MTKDKATTPPAVRKSGDFNVMIELVDTTWRMAVPVVILAGIGLVIDKAIGTAPLVTLLGTAIGFYFAALLVRRQLRRGRKGTDK